MAKKKRTKAQRAEAARLSWERRRKGLPPLTGPKRKRKGKSRTQVVAVVDDPTAVGFAVFAPGYEALSKELAEAFAQSAHGKGRQRHNPNGRPFDRQPILELARMYGPGFSAGQAAKKAQEALGMAMRGEREKAIHELHGAIVYLAATASVLRET
jgi:hypothetical protein